MIRHVYVPVETLSQIKRFASAVVFMNNDLLKSLY